MLTRLESSDLLSLADLRANEVQAVLNLAGQLKRHELELSFPRKTLGLLFRKASTRTRVSFSVAMNQLGGCVIDLDPNVIQVSRGEPVEDTARVLDRYVDVLASYLCTVGTRNLCPLLSHSHYQCLERSRTPLSSPS